VKLIRLHLLWFRFSTTVVTNEQRAGSVVFGSGRCVQGIGAVFASQTSVEAAPDRASRAHGCPVKVVP
jgi:hypothetical protein